MELTEVDCVLAVEVGDPVTVGGDHHGLILAELDGVTGVFDERGHIGADEHLPHTHPEHAQWSRPGLLCLLDVLHWLLGSEHPQPLPSCCRTSGRSKLAARSPSSSPRRPTTRCGSTPIT